MMVQEEEKVNGARESSRVSDSKSKAVKGAGEYQRAEARVMGNAYGRVRLALTRAKSLQGEASGWRAPAVLDQACKDKASASKRSNCS